MINKLLHTPDGVRDVFGEECLRKNLLKERLHAVISSFGYTDIETPTFEFFDVFGSDVGTIPSAELYKFFDREGNTLVLRPDFTPSMARAASRYFVDGSSPVRLCYQGSVFINSSSYRGRLKETTQIGAELMQDPSPEADAEQIAMVITALKAAGLNEFQVSLGNVRFFEGLTEAAGFDPDTVAELKNLIHNKNRFGVEELIRRQEKDIPHLAEAFSELPALFGGAEVLRRAAAVAGEIPQAMEALQRLETVLEILEEYGLTRYISIDLGMMSKYMYYTGILFRAYTYGVGEAVVKGGRYDALLRRFGKDAPAVGFVIVVDQLQSALERQNCMPETEHSLATVFAVPGRRKDAICLASQMRKEGKLVILRICDDPEAAANASAESDEASVQMKMTKKDGIVVAMTGVRGCGI